MATGRPRKQDEPRFLEDYEDRGVTVLLPAEDDESSEDLADETMFLIADETIRDAEEQLRLDRALGSRESASTHDSRLPLTTWLLPGGKFCGECLSMYGPEKQVRCCACGGSICPDCAIEIEELDAVLCPTCLRSNAEEA